MKKPVVGFCKISPQMCGTIWCGFYLASIRHCVISNKAVLVLEPLPYYYKPVYNCNCALEIVCKLLDSNITVIAEFEEGESRTGLHWVKLHTNGYNVLRLTQIAPSPVLKSADAEWVEDTPYGKVIYSAVGYIISISHSEETEVEEIPIIKTVFRSTLEKLVSESKAEIVNKDDTFVTYKITDEELAETVKKYIGDGVVVKSNVPKHILEHTTVIPL